MILWIFLIFGEIEAKIKIYLKEKGKKSKYWERNNAQHIKTHMLATRPPRHLPDKLTFKIIQGPYRTRKEITQLEIGLPDGNPCASSIYIYVLDAGRGG